MLTSVFVLLNGYQENCPSENCSPEICPREYCLRPPPPQKIAPNEKTSPLVWIVHPMKAPPAKITPPPVSSRNLPPRKLAPMKILPWINYTNERKDKFTKFFDLKKAVQHNILIEITKALFDTQMISQKILGLDTFFTEWKKIERKRKSPNGQVKEN